MPAKHCGRVEEEPGGRGHTWVCIGRKRGGGCAMALRVMCPAADCLHAELAQAAVQ